MARSSPPRPDDTACHGRPHPSAACLGDAPRRSSTTRRHGGDGMEESQSVQRGQRCTNDGHDVGSWRRAKRAKRPLIRGPAGMIEDGKLRTLRT